MKKIKHLTLSAALLLAAGTAMAQDRPILTGHIPMFGRLHLERLYQLSDYRLNLGTARSAAMGGAFTSLGADLSSMNINPAGLGMYRSSEFGVTFGPSFTNMTTSMAGQRSVTDSRSVLGLNNVGLAFNLFEGVGAVTSFTFGVGYNKLADFNYRYGMEIAAQPGYWSILDMYAPQLTRYVNGDDWILDAPWRMREVNMDEFGAVLAYQTDILDYDGTGTRIVGLDADALTAKNFSMLSKGSIGEYSFSGGWNFGNTLYFGVTFGLIDIYQNQQMDYTELYSNNDMGNEFDLEGINLHQQLKTVGEGYNFKIGLIYRPTTELRLGVAFHSPTFVNVKTYFNASMISQTASDVLFASSPERAYNDKYYSPSRLMAGLSYTISDKAIFAVDYEHVWFTGMNFRGEEYYQEDKDWMADEIKYYLKGSHTVRFGTEVRPMPLLALRAGYVYSSGGQKQFLKSGRDALSLPLPAESHTASLGAGYRITPSFSIDLTYSYAATKYVNYDMFYYRNTLPAEPEEIIPGGRDSEGVPYGSDMKGRRHNVLLSLNFRF